MSWNFHALSPINLFSIFEFCKSIWTRIRNRYFLILLHRKLIITAAIRFMAQLFSMRIDIMIEAYFPFLLLTRFSLINWPFLPVVGSMSLIFVMNDYYTFFHDYYAIFTHYFTSRKKVSEFEKQGKGLGPWKSVV